MHLEYPRCLHKAGGATLIVHSDDQRDAALKDGWSLLPVSDGSDPEPPKKKSKGA